MPTEKSTIDNIRQLIAEIKEYVILQKDYAKIQFVEKLTILLTALIMTFILITLGMVTLFYLLFSFAYIIEPLVGGLTLSFCIISLISILIMASIIAFRRKLITNPLVRFLTNLFLQDSNK
ncbi:phage holin family protein [uncultured Bacteroides sp.]|jgi:membrane-bound ClpP family serine protease|uniref:phage holin family protein n=1 Tax=uncultured Bacteroides sp. TaxID=162156 RepID=UPI002AA74929|nr:phage holin family protein [uncultured Bacteroides sp.]